MIRPLLTTLVAASAVTLTAFAAAPAFADAKVTLTYLSDPNWVKEGEIIQKGYVTVTDKPGIGVEMNEEAARKAQIPGTTWFEPSKT